MSVSAAPDLPLAHRVYVELALPEGGRTPSTVQLLVAGGTYNRQYWDLPDVREGTDRYSYVRAAVAHGFATASVDLLGRGRSSVPPSHLVGLECDAWVSHQLVEWLQSPASGQRFDNVVAVGHSLGTTSLWVHASRWNDLAGLVLTGATHFPDPGGQGALEWMTANEDPRWLSLDDGYVTTAAGTRSGFYDPGPVDSRLLMWDEEHRDVMTSRHLTDLPPVFEGQSAVQAPVLLVLGAADPLHSPELRADPGLLASSEGKRLGAPRSVDAYVLPESGHSLNGAPNAEDWFRAAQTWTASTVGGAGG
ncbi:MAG: alpha/beta hydrolase family protein [Nocardioides sp.]